MASTPPAGGSAFFQDLVYSISPSVNLICPICICPFIDAQSIECGHTFCADCLLSATAARFVCPTCRAECSRAPVPAYTVRSLVDELHVNCPNGGCAESMQRQFLVKHCQFDCLFRWTRCSYCDESIIANDLDHHLFACPAYLQDHHRHSSMLSSLEGETQLCMLTSQISDLALASQSHTTRLDGIDQCITTLQEETSSLRFTQNQLLSIMNEMIPYLSQLEHQMGLQFSNPPLQFEKLTRDIDEIRSTITRVELRANVDLKSESLRLRDELQAVKGLTLGLKSTVAYLTQKTAGPSRVKDLGVVPGDTKL